MRPLPPLYDLELSDDEAIELFRARKAVGTADEAMFLCQREQNRHMAEQNGRIEKFAGVLYKHLDGHPVSELVAKHLDRSRDADVREQLVIQVAGKAPLILGLFVSVATGALLTIQILDKLGG